MTFWPFVLVRLWLRFVMHCITAGLGTARIILQRETPPAGLVRLRYAPMSATGAAILGAMVTLSPGTSTIDIDPVRREILLHLLNRRAAAATLTAIRRDFERDLCRLFPEDT